MTVKESDLNREMAHPLFLLGLLPGEFQRIEQRHPWPRRTAHSRRRRPDGVGAWNPDPDPEPAGDRHDDRPHHGVVPARQVTAAESQTQPTPSTPPLRIPQPSPRPKPKRPRPPWNRRPHHRWQFLRQPLRDRHRFIFRPLTDYLKSSFSGSTSFATQLHHQSVLECSASDSPTLTSAGGSSFTSIATTTMTLGSNGLATGGNSSDSLHETQWGTDSLTGSTTQTETYKYNETDNLSGNETSSFGSS